MPLAADTFGGFGVEAEKAMRQVIKNAKLRCGSGCATHLRQNLQISVLRGVARQLLRHIPHHEAAEEADECIDLLDC